MLRARNVLLVLLCLLYVASWPGVAVRPVYVELTAPPLPKEIAERDGVLDVVVRAAEGDKPALFGARVRAFAMLDGRAHAAGDATTDAQGRARLESLPRAEHWIVAESPGRARASQMVVIVPGARRLDLELGPEHVLDVEVKSEQGAPIPAAEIEARGADPFPVGARTGDDGRARVGRLADGPWTVRVRATGYEEAVRRRVSEGAPLVVVLGKQGALVVKVEAPSGEPASGARVLVASPQLWPARVAETGADGTVRIGGLDGGAYALRATKGNDVSPIEIGVAIEKGEEKNVELRLAPGVMIAAHVVDGATEDDVKNARVTLTESGLSPFPLEGVTDKRGRAVLGPIAPGEATLSARAEGYVARGAVKVPEPVPSEVTIPLVRGGVLVGIVRDTRGWKIDGATIRVVGTDNEGMPIDEDPQRASFREAHFSSALAGPAPLIPAGELGVMPGPVPPIPHGTSSAPGAAAGKGAEPWVTGRDGTFRAEPVPPGRVRAYVTHPQYVEAMSDVVTLASDKEAHVEVVLSRGGVLEGRVTDAKGKVANALVTILATHGSLERTTRTGDGGAFGFASVPDSVTLLVAREEDITQVVARTELQVPEGGRKTIEIRLPEVRPALPVRVTGERGMPVDAAQVSAMSLDANEALRTTAFTNGRGEALVPYAKGLALRVEIRAPGRAAKIVTTTPDTAELEVALAAAEQVTGEIWGRRETIEGAEITLTTESGTRHARTGKDGSFTIGDLSAGPARLRVRAKGRSPLAKDVVVEDRGGRRATDLGRLELAEEAVVEGTVVDARGDPVPGARVGKDAVPTYLPASALPTGLALTDGRGRFHLAELPDGAVTLEAYAPDVGRGRTSVRVIAGRTLEGVRITLARGEASNEPLATGGVAITLGETAAGLDEPEVVVVAVTEGSEAEHAGLAPNDVLQEVGGVHVRTIADARARLSGPVHDDVVVKVRRNDRVFSLRIAREAVRR